jgi:Holliday junction DNA helicase RuvA
MIAYLEGTIIHINEKFFIINTNGTGYKVFVTGDTIASQKLNNKVTFWIYTAVRENSIDLYGFNNTDELSFFELLLDVSGIGPKSALSILGISSIDTLRKAIATGDTSYLNKVSGIGKKTAEKIVIELRDKLIIFKGENGEPNGLRDEGDVIEALKALGYSQNEAREAVKQLDPEIVGTNEKIKHALKILGNR